MTLAARLVALAATLIVAACVASQPTFEPDDKRARTTALLTPGADAGVTIVPMQGLPPSVARVLGQSLAESLQKREIAASTRTANQGSYLLQSEAKVMPLDDGRDRLELTWRLVGPTGLVVGTTTLSEPMPTLSWRSADERTLRPIADRAAERIEAMIRPQNTAPVANAPPPPRVAVRPVEGAPGDGRTSLTGAVRAILTRNNVVVVDREGPDTLLAVGTVRVQDRGAAQLVQIEWRVLKPDGETVGTVSQQNQLPKGVLDGPWGPIATAAAEGSAEGLMQILRAASLADAKKPGE
ncbi:MAG TPA: hypothetical protein VEU47_06255 [Candidatus Cybelea sp.]|nr:hypothetical protein [Candidatus Cybelea sp.]